VVTLFDRKEGGDGWAEFPLLLVLLVPCALLFSLGLGLLGRGNGAKSSDGEELPTPAWRSAALALAILLVPLTLGQLVEVIGGDPGAAFNRFWIFGVAAGLAAYTALRARVAFAALLAGVALLVAWLSLWDAIADPSPKAVRQLLAVAAVLLLGGAIALRRARLPYSLEVATVAGLSAVAAGIVGAISTAGRIAASREFGPFGTPSFGGIEQQEHWNVFLLLVSLALIVYGVGAAARGLAYIGGFGLVVFVLTVGAELASRAADERPDESFIGWPLLLILLGSAGLAAGFFVLGKQRRPQRERRQPPGG
jgi:hypothetical protein